ncbi:MAG: hypothetical protein NDI94_02765 [Candidatus Woesearchaeota archaeon]|nr:hypothetical protein [Candidatus Woesearchaeota archaeon]
MAITLDKKVEELTDNGSLDLGEGFIVSPRFSAERICSVAFSKHASLELYAANNRRVNIRTEGQYCQTDFTYFLTRGILKGTKKEILSAMDEGKINLMPCSMSPDAYSSAVADGRFIYLADERVLVLAMNHRNAGAGYSKINGLSAYGQTRFMPMDERQDAVSLVMEHASRVLCSREVDVTGKGRKALLGFIESYV